MVSCVIFLIFLCGNVSIIFGKYDPTWESLDSRPLPDWFDKGKIGIVLHWGVYSVPGYGHNAEWFWTYWRGPSLSPKYDNFMNKYYGSQFTYPDFASEFRAELFNPDQWATLFENAGAKYVVLTSKHGDGYAMWPSSFSLGWNSFDVGSRRDLLGELATSVRKKNLRFGVLNFLNEWFDRNYLIDKRNNWKTNNFVNFKKIPELKEIVTKYKPDLIWSWGDFEAPPEYWKSKEFLAWLYNESPVKEVVVTNDRWGSGTACIHGSLYTCTPNQISSHKWSAYISMDVASWGFRKNALSSEIRSSHELIVNIIKAVSMGGNIMINVGPTREGIIAPIFQERLTDIGTWLKINGEAIYESKPWTTQNDNLNSNVWYTARDEVVYVLVLKWPSNNLLSIGALLPLFSGGMEPHIALLGNENKTMTAEIVNERVNLALPDRTHVTSQWCWVVKIVAATPKPT